MFLLLLLNLNLIRPSQLEDRLRSSNYTFVNYFCGSCPHSIRTTEIWKQIEDHFKNTKRFNFLSIDCDRNHAACVEMGAEGYPLWVLYNPGSTRMIKYGRDKIFTKFEAWVKQNTGISAITDL